MLDAEHLGEARLDHLAISPPCCVGSRISERRGWGPVPELPSATRIKSCRLMSRRAGPITHLLGPPQRCRQSRRIEAEQVDEARGTILRRSPDGEILGRAPRRP